MDLSSVQIATNESRASLYFFVQSLHLGVGKPHTSKCSKIHVSYLGTPIEIQSKRLCWAWFRVMSR